MALLDCQYLNYNPFEQKQHQLFQDPYDELVLPPEAELLCFDPLPPTLFDFDVDFEVPLFNPPPPLELDHLTTYEEFIVPKDCMYPCFEFPPPMVLPAEDHYYYEDDYSTDQYLPFSKKQKLCLPCYDGFMPDFSGVNNEVTVVENNPIYQQCTHTDTTTVVVDGGGTYNVGCGDDGQNESRGREVSAQSRAARERRRKITEKTQELGKLVPGGTKMNTAEMLQSASMYVKFLQAQMGILQSMKTIHQESEEEAHSSNLTILASPLVQEKLSSKEQCLVPLDFLPKLEEHYEFKSNPSITQHINELLR